MELNIISHPYIMETKETQWNEEEQKLAQKMFVHWKRKKHRLTVDTEIKREEEAWYYPPPIGRRHTFGAVIPFLNPLRD